MWKILVVVLLLLPAAVWGVDKQKLKKGAKKQSAQNAPWHQYERNIVWSDRFGVWDKWPIKEGSCKQSEYNPGEYANMHRCEIKDQSYDGNKPIAVDLLCEMATLGGGMNGEAFVRVRYIRGYEYCNEIMELDKSGELDRRQREENAKHNQEYYK